MSRVILILEQNTLWTTFGHGSRRLDSREPQGLQQAIFRGAELVEQIESYVSRTGHADHRYTKWRVSLPVELIGDLKGGVFEGLKATAPIPL